MRGSNARAWQDPTRAVHAGPRPRDQRGLINPPVDRASTIIYDSVEALQADLDEWLVHYNTERPHLGYRNLGRRPVKTVMSFVRQEG